MSTLFKQIKSETLMYEASELYTKLEVDNKIGSVIHYKGSVATYADLPSTGQQVGDMWNVKATGKNYVWAENPEMKDPPEPGWDDISTTVDLSNYYTKSDADAAFATKGELTTLSGTVTNHTGNDAIHVTQADKTAWSNKQAKIEVSGILKGDGTGGVSAAVAGTDYVAPSALNNYVPTSRTVNSKALSADIELDGSDITTTYQHGDTMQISTVNEAFARTMTQIEGVRTLANGKIANAVSKVKVGSTTISTSGEDTLEIVGSGSVTVTPDATNKKLTISSSSAVTSVNSKTGAVVLTAADVGAAASTHSHAISDVTNLQSTLNGKVDKSTLTTYLTTDSSTGVLKAFPTENYSIEELVTHYNNLLTALRNMVGTLS